MVNGFGTVADVKQFLFGIAAVVLLIASPAAAHTTIIEPPESHYPYQGWADESKVPTPAIDARVVEIDQADPAFPCVAPYSSKPRGCVVLQTRTIYLDPTVAGRSVVMHEIGHLFDVVALTDADRMWFTHLFNLGGPWLSDETHDTPGESFATSYAICALYRGRKELSMLVPPEQFVGARRINQLCRWIAHAAQI